VQLPGKQLQLLQLVAAGSATPVTLVTVNAGMLDLSWVKGSAKVGAILNAPYLGMQAGTAIAQLLLGEWSPAGRLTMTYYKNISDIGPMGSYELHPTLGGLSPKGRTYRCGCCSRCCSCRCYCSR